MVVLMNSHHNKYVDSLLRLNYEVIFEQPLTKLREKGKALTLEDCECAGLKIHDSVNGEVVSAALYSIFKQTGDPVAILKDKGTDLSRGVSLWKENNQLWEYSHHQ